jgi:hypothetical protein
VIYDFSCPSSRKTKSTWSADVLYTVTSYTVQSSNSHAMLSIFTYQTESVLFSDCVPLRNSSDTTVTSRHTNDHYPGEVPSTQNHSVCGLCPSSGKLYKMYVCMCVCVCVCVCVCMCMFQHNSGTSGAISTKLGIHDYI